MRKRSLDDISNFTSCEIFKLPHDWTIERKVSRAARALRGRKPTKAMVVIKLKLKRLPKSAVSACRTVNGGKKSTSELRDVLAPVFGPVRLKVHDLQLQLKGLNSVIATVTLKAR